MIDWHGVDTILLDMDGTLLDLNYDTHFWLEYVPQRYAEKHGMQVAEAREELLARYRHMEGTMEWYCIDYWTGQLGLDIAQLKQEVDHLIAVHPHVFDFLDAARTAGKHLALVTNAHSKSLELKMKKTDLGRHFDDIICAHDYGMPKEQPGFWPLLQKDIPFSEARTLLVDDSLPVLRSARNWGIRWLLAVLRPDTRAPERDVSGFDAISSFDDLLPFPD